MLNSTTRIKPVNPNPEKLERGESKEAFQDGLGADIEKNVEVMMEKATRTGDLAATDGVKNQDALGKSAFSFANIMSGAGQRWIPASALFVLGTISLAVLGTAGAWYNSDVLDALFVVLSALLTLTYIYQYYLYKLRQGCDMAKEDFGKKCQQSEMFTFLFLYQISSLDVGDEILCGLPLHLLKARLVVEVLELF